jgi:hypothetical protein
MTHSERFRAIFSNQPVDRLPSYFFGTWLETKARWKAEGLSNADLLEVDAGPEVPGMDPDWESGMWECHGLAYVGPFGTVEYKVLQEDRDTIVFRDSMGAVIRNSKTGSTIPHVLEHGLKPTRESWKQFQSYLNSYDPQRHPEGWEQKAEALAGSGRMLAFMGGSLYGWLRNWMGVEQISLLMYDDPMLFEDMVSFFTDHFITVMAPVLKKVRFDLVYFFEDCCGATGPLFSPAMYRDIFDKYYKKLIRFYKDNGVAFSLVDSDGKVDKLIPSWLGSGFDIIFPVEVGTWGATPENLRKQFGSGLKMLGGVNKHVIPKGEAAVREHLLSLKPAVEQGGYLPMPDHRIPPECSYTDFQTYLRVYREVFAVTGC